MATMPSIATSITLLTGGASQTQANGGGLRQSILNAAGGITNTIESLNSTP